MDATAIQALASSLGTAVTVSKSLFDLKLTTEVQAKVAELQRALLAAQNSALAATGAQMELQQRVAELEELLKKADAWEQTRERYSLVSPWKGAAQVYALQRDEASGEEPHFLCTNCFESGRRSFLNPQQGGSRLFLRCPNCDAKVDTGYRGIGPPQYADEYQETEPDS